MSQQEVLDILKDGKWHCVTDMAKKIGKPVQTITKNISLLGYVERRRIYGESKLKKTYYKIGDELLLKLKRGGL